MSLDNGGPLDQLAAKVQALFDALSPEEQRAYRREQRISFAFGNVNLHRLERGLPELPREAFERAVDEIDRNGGDR